MSPPPYRLETDLASRALDVFRGWAGVFMVVNHAGYALMTREAATSGVPGALVFIGSMAPVLFFFATGVGMGLGQHRAGAVRDAAIKCGWLLLADLMLNTGLGRPLALNFLGFIGLSMFLVALVRTTARPVFTAAVVSLVLLAMRYGPWPAAWAAGWGDGVLAGFVTGRHGTQGLAYPLSPWLVYPMLGFLLARCCQAGSRMLAWPSRSAVLLALAVFCATAAVYASLRDASFLRWGTVAIAFFVASVSVLAICWLVSNLMAGSASRRPAVATVTGAMSLRGSPSLLIVPVHYVLLTLVEALGWPPVSPPAWIALTLAIVVLAWSLAKALPRWGARWMPVAGQRRFAIAVLFAAAALIAWALGAGRAALLAGAAGQCVVAIALDGRRRHVGLQASPTLPAAGRTHSHIIQGGTP